jgi:outer membrane biosynthesis protein TonB
MKRQLQFQQAMQHILNVAKNQSTIVKTTPPPPAPQPEPVAEVPVEPIVEAKPVKETKKLAEQPKVIEQPKVVEQFEMEQSKIKLPSINK